MNSQPRDDFAYPLLHSLTDAIRFGRLTQAHCRPPTRTPWNPETTRTSAYGMLECWNGIPRHHDMDCD